MQRGEAIQVLRGVINVCADNSVFINSVSLIPPSKDNGLMGYQLRIGTRLDNDCRESLMPLLRRNHLEIEESSEFIRIYRPA